mgnify:CR=1 FL=1
MRFKFSGIGFGMGPTKELKVVYSREFERDFCYTEDAAASFFDRYTLTQWGFYFTAQCEILTDKGTFVARYNLPEHSFQPRAHTTLVAPTLLVWAAQTRLPCEATAFQ